MIDWKSQGDGPKWVPVLNATEDKYAIPTDLLARVAYQESRFREDIISGATTSSAGCVGIMQLNPEYFPDAGKDPKADINSAGQLLQSLYGRFNDWQVALAAYNWGGGNEHHQWMADGRKYLLADCPPETQAYVTQIIADVPVPGSLLIT
jgi:soluble lytic murein transglycosylase-like protein